jgi:hypothetical protein
MRVDRMTNWELIDHTTKAVKGLDKGLDVYHIEEHSAEQRDILLDLAGAVEDAASKLKVDAERVANL